MEIKVKEKKAILPVPFLYCCDGNFNMYGYKLLCDEPYVHSTQAFYNGWPQGMLDGLKRGMVTRAIR